MTLTASARTPLAPLRAVVPATVLALAVIRWGRWGPDWPAQEFRAWLAGQDGLIAWTTRWYGGQALPGYSVLYPLVAGAVGAAGAGVLAVAAGAWGAMALRPASGQGSRWYAAAVALTLAQSLLIGQVPFLMGAAFGVWALSATRSGRLVPALGCAVAASLCSPLAGAFVLLAAPSWLLAVGLRKGWPLAGATTGIAVSALVGGAGGTFPCPWQSAAGVLLFCAAILVLTTRTARALRCFALCYAATAAVLFAVPNPIGGNVGRLGKLVAVPLAVHLLAARRDAGRGRHRAGVAVTAALAVLWPGVPFATAIAKGADDPSQAPAYYAGLDRYLRTQDPTLGRLEIPFTQAHWEAMWVARDFPIARGWERQTDLADNEVLYDTMTPAAYRRWLDDNAVRLVALPDVPIDAGGRPEVALLRRGLPYLRPVWHDRHWQVWRVEDARPLTSGPATMTALGESSFGLSFSRPGRATIRLRASSMWQVRSVTACVAADPRGWLTVSDKQAGPVTVSARLGLAVGAPPTSCVPGAP